MAKKEQKNELMSVLSQVQENENADLDADVFQSNAKKFLMAFAKSKLTDMVESSQTMKDLKKRLVEQTDYSNQFSIAKTLELLTKCEEADLKLIDKLSSDDTTNIIINDNSVNTNNIQNQQNNNLTADLKFESKQKIFEILSKIKNSEQDS